MARLRPRARIIRTIGDQLISGPEAALIELVKNAYDADADSVLVRLAPASSTNSADEIVVCDDGHGMTSDDVIKRWFEPATDEKLKRQFSPGGRRLLGAKGIGRFASSRLGSKTRLRSWARVSASQLEETTVDVDWNSFSAEEYLDEIEIPLESRTIENLNRTTGVELQISDLRDSWTKVRLERLIRELRRVVSPAVIDTSFAINLDLTEITELTHGFDGPDLLAKANFDISARDASEDLDPTRIIPFRVTEFADYSLEGEFDEAGAFAGTFVNYRGDGVVQNLVVAAPPLNEDEAPCGPVTLRLNICDREQDAVQALFSRIGLTFSEFGIRAARKLLSDNSGIAIFRQGFRVRPYGEPENDWLEMERQRVQNPSVRLGISQVSGQVTVASEKASNLIERSSREGLEHNDAFTRLKTLVHGVLRHAEQRRLAFREKAGISRKAAGDVSAAKTLAGLPKIRKAAESAPAPFKSTLEKAIDHDSAALSASLEELDAFQRILQSRAALGLVVAQVIHEGRRILNPLSEASKALQADAEHLLADSPLGRLARNHLAPNLAQIANGAGQLSRLIKRLDPISGRRRGAPRDFDVLRVLEDVVAIFQSNGAGVDFVLKESREGSVLAHGFPEDLQSAVMNLVENATHWIRSEAPGAGVIFITVSKRRTFVDIEIANDGPPIDDAYVPRLFEAGFSLRPEGTGLGLAIAREACHASKGELRFNPDSDLTAFVVSFPAAK